MTGYQSKRAAAQDKLDDDDTQVYQDDTLTIAYQSGYYDGKKAAQPAQEPIAARPCRNCDGTGERYTGIDEAPTSICIPCKGTGQIALAQPKQRPWVGLTDEQIADFLGDEYHDMSESELRFFRLGEAATKEKNT